MNSFNRQGKALPNNMPEKIVDDWLQDKGPTEIRKELKLDKQTVSSIVDNFVRKGHVEAGKGGNKIRSQSFISMYFLRSFFGFRW